MVNVLLAMVMLMIPLVKETLAESEEASHAPPDEVWHALEYCRWWPSTITLNYERTVLCFDGRIASDLDLSIFHRLKERGYFVMRSPGGAPRESMLLANILREKRALVILYDYCLSACANYVLVANRTFIRKDTIVAWHGGLDSNLAPTECHGAGLKLSRQEYSARYGADTNHMVDKWCEVDVLLKTFFKERKQDTGHIHEPQTHHTQKMVRFALKEEIDKRRVYWMWNPKNYGDHFKSRVIFDSYPQSQDEVDSIASRLQLGIRIVFDP